MNRLCHVSLWLELFGFVDSLAGLCADRLKLVAPKFCEVGFHCTYVWHDLTGIPFACAGFCSNRLLGIIAKHGAYGLLAFSLWNWTSGFATVGS